MEEYVFGWKDPRLMTPTELYAEWLKAQIRKPWPEVNTAYDVEFNHHD